MEHISFLRTVFLVFLFQIHGSSAVTHVFVEKGNDVLLEVPKSFVRGSNDILLWRFNQKNNIVRFIPGTNSTIFDNYIGRISVTNYSVKLKNLQAADSGVYEARVSGAEEQSLAEYNVTVQDPVSPVGLNVTKGGGASGSSDSCIVNATCSTADSDISSSFTCADQTCDQDGGEQSKVTNSGASLRIYLSNALIICNHSNQVSWTKNTTKIQDLCPEYLEQKTSSISVGPSIGIVVAAIIIFAGIIYVVFRCQKKRKYDRENAENTVYATPEGFLQSCVSCCSCLGFFFRLPRVSVRDHAASLRSDALDPITLLNIQTHHSPSTQTSSKNRKVGMTQTRAESPPNDASCASPTSTYSLVGPHRLNEQRSNPLPESLYAQVEKPARNLQEL